MKRPEASIAIQVLPQSVKGDEILAPNGDYMQLKNSSYFNQYHILFLI